MSAIESEDDLWAWVEYFSEVVALQSGLGSLALNEKLDLLDHDTVKSNTLSLLFVIAH